MNQGLSAALITRPGLLESHAVKVRVLHSHEGIYA
jgi:hypothetical protein